MQVANDIKTGHFSITNGLSTYVETFSIRLFIYNEQESTAGYIVE